MVSSQDEGLTTELKDLDASFPVDVESPANWPRAAELLPALDGVPLAEATGDDLRVAVSLLYRAARFEFARGNCEPALTRAQAAVEAAAGMGEVAEAADPHRILALAVFQFEREEEAKEEAERALHLRSLSADPGDEAVREDRVLLSEALSNLDRLNAAREEIDRALSSIPDGTLDRAAAKARGHLAWLLLLKRDYREASTLCRQAVEELGEVCGPSHPETLSLRVNLGYILASDEQYEAAREELESTLSRSAEVLGEAHPSVDLVRGVLGMTMQMEGDDRAAKIELEAALKHGEEVLPPTHRHLTSRHLWLAHALEGLGDRDAALAQIDAAIAIGRAVERPRPARLGADLIARAKLLERIGNDPEAYETFAEARSILAASTEPEARRRGECEVGMGRAAETQGNLTTARAHLEAAVRAFGEVEDDEAVAGWEQAAKVELAAVSARIAEELAASCQALDQPVAARTILDRGRELFIEVLADILAGANPTGAIAVADAARQSSAPKVAFKALEQAESSLKDGGSEKERRRVGAAWHRLGRSCRRQGEEEQALEAFAQALRMLDRDPQFMGVIDHDIGEVHAEHRRWKEAADLYRRAIELKLEGGDPQTDRASTMIALARAQMESGDEDGALQVYADCRAALDAAPTPERRMEVLLLEDLGALKYRDGDADGATDLFGRAAILAREVGEPNHLASTLLALGRAQNAAGDRAGAMKTFEERLEIMRSLPRPDLQGEGVTLHEISNLRREEGDLPAAVELLREAADRKRRGGEFPRDLGVTLLALGRILVRLGDFTEAVATFEERLAILRSQPEPEIHNEAVTLHEMGVAQSNLGRQEEAIATLRHAEALEREAGETEALAITLLALGRVLLAEEDHEGALAVYDERLGLVDDPQSRGVTLHDIAAVHRAREEYAEAAKLYREAAAEKRKGGGTPGDLAVTLYALARVLRAGGEARPAVKAFEERLEVLRSFAERDAAAEAVTLQEMAETLAGIDRAHEAAARYEEAVARQREVAGGGDKLTAFILGEANLRLRLRQLEQSRSLTEEAVGRLREEPGSEPTRLSAALMTLGEVAMLDEDADRAVTVFEEADELLVEVAADPIDIAILRRQLAEAYAATGRDEDADKCREDARAALADGLEEGVKNPTLLTLLAVLAVEVGSPELADKVIEEARTLVAADPTSLQQKRLLADVLRAVGRAYEVVIKKPAGALGPYSEQLEILESLPTRDKDAEGRVHRDLADVHRALGDPAAAIASYRAAADCLLETEDRLAAATCLRDLAETQAAEDDHGDALATLEERLGLLGEEPAGEERSRLELATLERMARYQLAAGSEAEARESLARAEQLRAEGGSPDEEIAEGLKNLAAKLA